MLPPGHVAAGFLTAQALLHLTKPELTSVQIQHLVYWSMFFSFAPDLDCFVAFAKLRSWWYKPGADGSIHRKFYSHVPLLWLVAALIFYAAAPTLYYKYAALMLLAGSWSHLVLDSIDGGIMWLWPFNSEVWALRNRGMKGDIQASGFFSYWVKMVRSYMTCWTFYAEVLILLVTLIIYLY
jgi:membrane-bound metal-dependent hydrolase YbcI (DUF457 family)